MEINPDGGIRLADHDLPAGLVRDEAVRRLGAHPIRSRQNVPEMIRTVRAGQGHGCHHLPGERGFPFQQLEHDPGQRIPIKVANRT